MLAHMLLKRYRKLRTFSFLDGNEVFNAQGIEYLATKTFRCHTGTNSLARCVHRSCSARRTAADYQHIERGLGGDFLRFALNAAGIDFRQYLFQTHSTLAELGPVEKHGRHGHDLARLDFVLKQRTINHGGFNARVLYCHQVQRLNHVGAAVAGQ